MHCNCRSAIHICDIVLVRRELQILQHSREGEYQKAGIRLPTTLSTTQSTMCKTCRSSAINPNSSHLCSAKQYHLSHKTNISSNKNSFTLVIHETFTSLKRTLYITQPKKILDSSEEKVLLLG